MAGFPKFPYLGRLQLSLLFEPLRGIKQGPLTKGGRRRRAALGKEQPPAIRLGPALLPSLAILLPPRRVCGFTKAHLCVSEGRPDVFSARSSCGFWGNKADFLVRLEGLFPPPFQAPTCGGGGAGTAGGGEEQESRAEPAPQRSRRGRGRAGPAGNVLGMVRCSQGGSRCRNPALSCSLRALGLFSLRLQPL